MARELLDALDVGGGVRLLGVSGQQLVRRAPGSDSQGSLFGEEPGQAAAEEPTSGGRAALERSVDAVRARFGPGAVGPGRANSLPREGPGRPTR